MSAVIDRRPVAASPWRTALPALVVVLAAVLLLYRDTAQAMVGIWLRSETFTHAVLVPPIVLWLVWRRRAELAALTPRPMPWVLALMVATAAGWLLGELTATNALAQFALVSLLVLAVPAVTGWAVTRALLFPLGFAFFMVPIGEFMMPRLMLWTADFTVAALRLSGIPVFREGLQFVIPTGTWSVVEACSGVRYLIASVMVGVLFAHLNYRSTKRRLAFVAVAILVPIVANWVRAYGIVMLGHVSNNKLAAGVDHLVYGWLFFGVVIALMFVIGARWAEPDAPPVVAPAGRGAAVAASTLWLGAAAAVLVAAAPHLALGGLMAAETAGAPALAEPAIAGLRAAPATPGWTPVFEPRATLQRTWRSPDGAEVGVYLGYYRQQGGGHKLVSSSNTLAASDDKTWLAVAGGTHVLEAAGQPLAVRTARLRGRTLPGDTRLAVWQLYWVNGQWTSSDVRAKLLGAVQRLRGGGDDAAVLILHTPEARAGAADPVLEAFVRQHLGAVEAALRSTRDGR